MNAKTQLKVLGISLVTSVILACTQQVWSPTRPTSQSTSQDMAVKGSDRPTETGAGVPGYLVNCSVLTDRSDVDLPVACGLVDQDNQPVPGGADAWKRYDFVAPKSAPATLQVQKQMSDQPEVYDVLFTLSGAERKVLVDVALGAQYSFAYEDAQGKVTPIMSKPLAAVEDASVVAAPAAGQACPKGVSQDGICFFLTARSCENACEQVALKVHPAVVDKFGSAAASNAENCKAMYQQIKGTSNLRFASMGLMTGLGCHQTPTGLVLFDENNTRTGAYPALGGNRLCGCQ